MDKYMVVLGLTAVTAGWSATGGGRSDAIVSSPNVTLLLTSINPLPVRGLAGVHILYHPHI